MGALAVSLIIAGALVYNVLPGRSKAASTFFAGWDRTGTILDPAFNADSARGSRTASNIGTTIVDGGIVESNGVGSASGKALKVDPKQGIRYETRDNLDLSRSKIETNFKLNYNLSGNDMTSFQFTNPGQVALDTTGGKTVMYVADAGANRIVRMEWDGSKWTNWDAYGQFGSGAGQFNNPTSIAFDSTNKIAIIGDSGNCRVIRIHWNGNGWDSWHSYGYQGTDSEQFYTNGATPFSTFYYDVASKTLMLADEGRIIRMTWKDTGDVTTSEWGNWVEVTDNSSHPLNKIKSLTWDSTNSILYFINYQVDPDSGAPTYYLCSAHWTGNAQNPWENWHGNQPGDTGFNASADNKFASLSLAGNTLYATDSGNLYSFSVSTPGQPSLSATIQSLNGGSVSLTNVKGMLYDADTSYIYLIDPGINEPIVRAHKNGGSWNDYSDNGGRQSAITSFSPIDTVYDSDSGTIFIAEATRIVALHLTNGMIDNWYNYSGTLASPFTSITRISYDSVNDALYALDLSAPYKIRRLTWTGSAFGTETIKTLNSQQYGNISSVSGFVFDSAAQTIFMTMPYYYDGSWNGYANSLVKVQWSQASTTFADPVKIFDSKNGFLSSSIGTVTTDPDISAHKIYVVDGSGSDSDAVKIISWTNNSGNITLDTSHAVTKTLAKSQYLSHMVYSHSEQAIYGIDPVNYHVVRAVEGATSFTVVNYGQKGTVGDYGAGGARVNEGFFGTLKGISLDKTNGNVYVGDNENRRIAKMKWNGSSTFDSWATYADPWHYIMTTSGQFPLRVRLNIATSRLEFYDSAGGNEIFAQTDPIQLLASTWYKLHIDYNSTTGAYGVSISDYSGADGSLSEKTNKQISAASWTAPTTLGANFYLGSDKNQNYDQRSLGGYLDNFSIESLAPPPAPHNLSGPAGWSKTNNYRFSWDKPTSTEFGYNDIDKYEFLITNNEVTSQTGTWKEVKQGAANCSGYTDADGTVTCTIDGNTDVRNGTNTFHLRAVNSIAGTISDEVTTSFYYSNTAPQKPRNLTVTPAENTLNSFAFNWDTPEPGSYQGDPNGSGLLYHYVVNAFPNSTGSNMSATMGKSLTTGAYATIQNNNVMYMIAEDAAGNVDYTSCNKFKTDDHPEIFLPNDTAPAFDDKCTYVIFNAKTTAPGIPTDLIAKDISDRDSNDYEVVLKWSPPVEIPNSNNVPVAGYQVYRANGTEDSNKNVTCPSVWDDSVYTAIPKATPTDTNYIDAGLQSKPYCYAIKARDNAQKLGEAFMMVNGIHPAGIYKTPPTVIDGPTIEIGALTSTIKWTTDRETSSLVKYGTDKDHLSTEIGKSDVYSVNHSVTIKTDAGTAYYYVVASQDRPDDGGKRQTSEVQTFTSKELPYFTEVEIPEDNITLSSAVITYKTSQPATTSIMYAANSEFAENKVIDDKSGYTVDHTINLTNLTHSTKYYFKISGVDIHGDPLNASIVQSFSTLTMPVIVGNVQYDQDKEAPTTTYRFSWKTNIKTSSVIYYTNSAGQKSSASSPDMTTDHSLTIPNLADKSIYTFEVTGVDEHGVSVDNAYKAQIITPEDTRPPKISNLTVEVKSSGFGTNQKAQIVVTWQTDEPGTSQVEYDQGISGDSYANKSKTDQTLSTSHAVILADLEPSRIYHLRAISADASGNVGHSEDTTTITGKMQNSVLDIIMNSLQSSMGWIFGIFNRQ